MTAPSHTTGRTEARALWRRWSLGNKGDAAEARLFAWVKSTVEHDGDAAVWRRLGCKKGQALVLIELAGIGPAWTETPSLSTEQARGLAARFVEKCDACRSNRNAPDADAECTDTLGRDTQPLTDPEREQLFAWVRRDVRGTGSSRAKWPTLAHRREMAVGHLATELGLTIVDAWHLAEAAGWPS